MYEKEFYDQFEKLYQSNDLEDLSNLIKNKSLKKSFSKNQVTNTIDVIAKFADANMIENLIRQYFETIDDITKNSLLNQLRYFSRSEETISKINNLLYKIDIHQTSAKTGDKIQNPNHQDRLYSQSQRTERPQSIISAENSDSDNEEPNKEIRNPRKIEAKEKGGRQK